MNRLFRLLSALVLTTSVVVFGLVSPAHALGAMTQVDLNTSSSGAGDTGVRYTYTFTTVTTGAISSITFAMPAGTAGTPTVSDYFGIGPGTAALSGGNLITYTVTTPVSMTSGRTILIAFEGVTNTTTVGSYVPTVTTTQDAGSGTAVAVTPSSADIVIDVARVITFTTGSPSISLATSSASAADQTSTANTFTIATNAGSGYSLSARANALTSSGGATITAVSTGPTVGVASASFPVNRWGFTLGSLTNGGAGTLSSASGLTGGQYAGFPTSSAVIASNTGPTNGDSFPLTARVKIDATQAAGTYKTTLVFTAAATY